jgi:hypothetical protein
MNSIELFQRKKSQLGWGTYLGMKWLPLPRTDDYHLSSLLKDAEWRFWVFTTTWK